MIKLENVSKSYNGNAVLENISLSIQKGERLALMAPSGQGKTTLVRLICKLEKPDLGTVTVEGKISAVFQEDRLFEHLSVFDNVNCICRNPEITQNVLEGMLMWEDRNKLPRELSGGMARRVAIARALAFSHDILILDEPFKGLDEKTRSKVIDFIKKQEAGKTVLLVTHDKEEILLLGGEIYEFEQKSKKTT